MHHLQIEFDNEKYGLTLARDTRTNELLYIMQDTKKVSPMYATARQSYANLDPEREVVTDMEYFHGGFGLEDYEENYRYYETVNADARRKGRVVLGPSSTAVTLPSTPTPIMITINDPSFESWTSTTALTYWTIESGTITKEDGTNLAPYHNRFCGRRATNGLIYQDVTWSATFQSQEFTAAAYLYGAGGGNDIRINIDDGKSTTSSAWYGIAAWALKTVTKTLAADATRLRVEIEFGADAYFDMAGVYPTSGQHRGQVHAFADYNSNLYIAVGGSLLKYNGSTLSHIKSFTYPITSMGVYGDYLYIGQMGDMYWYMDTSETCTQASGADDKFDYCQTIGSTFYVVRLPNSYDTSTAPPAFAGATALGNKNVSLTGIVRHPSTVRLLKEDGLWSTTAQLTPLLEQDRVTDGCKNSIAWGDKVYLKTGVSSLWEFDDSDDTLASISPSDYISNSAYIDDIQALVGDQSYLYAIQDYSTKVNLFAGRYETIDNSTDWRWHPIAQITSADVTAAHISSVGAKKLWYGTVTPTLGYFAHPTQFGDVDSDSNYTFASSGTLTTAWIDCNFPDDEKNWYSLDVHGSNLSATQYISISYQLQGRTDWELLGVCDIVAPFRLLYFPEDVHSKKIRIKVTLATGDTATSPVLEKLFLYSQIRPEKRKEFTFTALLSNVVDRVDGFPQNMNVEGFKKKLLALDKKEKPIILYDIDGIKYHATIQGISERILAHDPASKKYTRGLTMNLLETKWKGRQD